MDAPLSPAPLSPLARYEQATAPGGWLTSSGWSRLADDLARWPLSSPNRTREFASKCEDRAADCRARAAAMTRGAL